MPTFNRVRDAYSTKKKNALSPYLTSGMSQSPGASQPRQAQTMQFDASGTTAASQPSGGQSAVSRAYSRATTPASTASPQQYEPGSILREAAAPANPSKSANNANAASAITNTPNTPLYSAYNAQTTPPVSSPTGAQNSAVYRAYSAQSTPQQSAAEAPSQSAVQRAYGSQNGSYSAQRQNAINQATANYNRLLNYLPEYLDIMGMRGLGVSEQALLNAASDYQQGISDINASYDELERAYRDQQIANASTVYANLSEYITGAGDNFTQEGYDRFKQGLLQAGYTEQEIAAGENMLQQSEWTIIDNNKREQEVLSNNPDIIGIGIALDTAQEEDFGSYYDTGKPGTGQYQLVQDILTAARSGKISNGSIVDFNYGNHAEEKFFVYYDGYFYEINPYSVDPKKDKIIGRGRNSEEYIYQPPEIYVENWGDLSPEEQYRIRDEALRRAQNSAKKGYEGYIDPNDL